MLKRKLTQAKSNFYLLPARNPRDTYKVLWYRVHEIGYFVNCKVDLLFPGILDIPNIPVSEIDRTNVHNIPCIPLSPLLLLKLQGWIHHGESDRDYVRRKQPADVLDINDLLRICRQKGIRPRDDPYLSIAFKTTSESRVMEYVEEYPYSAIAWTELGYTCS
jgi:hypothetical protein